MVRVVITGGSGFCGTHLAKYLRRTGHYEIIGASIRWSSDSRQLFDKTFDLDMRNAENVRTFVRTSNPDFIYHLAGITAGSSRKIYETNVLGTLYLLEAVQAFAPNAALLIVGSAAEYGAIPPDDLPVSETHSCSPITAHGISKYAATMASLDLARREGLKIICVRPFNVIGPGMPSSLVIGALIRRMQALNNSQTNRALRVGRLDTQRDFVSVYDLVEGYCQIMGSESWGEVVNFCSGEATSISSIIHMLFKLTGKEFPLEVDPHLLRPSDVLSMYGSWEKAYRLCGFTPKRSLEETLRDTWAYAMHDSHIDETAF
jgi:GDP-4-dehydro-6-deoxy-D-mannose reductase